MLNTIQPPFLIKNDENWQCDENCLSTKPPAEMNGGTSPVLLDINKKPVHYELRFNQPWLFSALDYRARINNDKIFTMGACQGGIRHSLSLPSIMIKLAWKVLDTIKEDESRFITMKVSNETYGLVAMHIAVKTSEHWEWIWSTFEHVNNFSEYQFGEELVTASFEQHDSQCPGEFAADCIPSLIPFSPILAATSRINELVKKGFEQQKSPLQYYQMLGVQYKLNESMGQEQFKKELGDDMATGIINECVEKDSSYYVSADSEKYLLSYGSNGKCSTINEIINPGLYNPVFEPFPSGDDNKSCISCHVDATYKFNNHPYPADFSFTVNNIKKSPPLTNLK
jgi:hypothetical protein